MHRLDSCLSALTLSLVALLTSCGSTTSKTLPADLPNSLYVTPNQIDAPVGSTQQLLVFSSDTNGDLISVNGAALEWTSSITSIATISNRGLVTIVSSGSATGRAATSMAQGEVRIRSDANAQIISAVRIEQLGVGNSSAQWRALAVAPDGTTTDVTENGVWISSDNSIISIGVLNGTAKFLKPSGQVYITFRYGPLSSTKGVILGGTFTP